VSGGVVTYYRNGAAVYTSAAAASGALVADASIATVGNAVTNVSISGSTTTTTTTTTTTSGSTTLRVLQWNTHHGGYGTDGVYSPDR